MAATDTFSTNLPGLDHPYTDGEAVTPHDANDLAKVSRGIYVGGAGAVAVVLVSGTVLTLAAVPAGTVLRVRAKRVNATNTTATNMVALY